MGVVLASAVIVESSFGDGQTSSRSVYAEEPTAADGEMSGPGRP